MSIAFGPRPEDLGDGTPERPRLCVETWLVVPGELDTVILLRRIPDAGGFWQGVSGCVEEDDATLAACALREIAEETGLDSTRITLHDLGHTREFDGFVSGARFRKRCLWARLPEGTDLEHITLSPDEHDAVCRVPLHVAQELVRFDEHRDELDRLAARLAKDSDSDGTTGG